MRVVVRKSVARAICRWCYSRALLKAVDQPRDERGRFARGEGFSVFVGLPDTTMVGVDVKNAGRNLNVNSVSTVFKREIESTEEIVYPAGKVVSPEQSALLARQKLTISASGDTKGSIPHRTKKSSAHTRLVIRKSIADYVQRRWGYPTLLKANPHHDERGRFASKGGGVDVGSRVKDQHGVEHIIQRKVKTQGGNFVFVAYTKTEHEERDNLAACEVLSDKLGWTCVLLPRSNLVKTADMLNASSREFWEIKTNRTGTTNSVKNEMRRGAEQSENVIIRFDIEKLNAADFSYEKMKQEVVKRKREVTKLKKIMLITGKRIELIP